MSKPQWYKMAATDDTEASIEIIGDIGSGWFGDVSLKEFKADFDKIRGKDKINVLVNSYGGDVFEGIAIYNVIASEKEKVAIEVLGIAASAASIIALAGDTLIMGEGSFFMIHNAWGFAMGNASDMRQMADTLEKISGELVSIYENSSDLSGDEIRDFMDAETWFTAEEAVEHGFAGETVDRGKVAASVQTDKYNYKHIPEGFAACDSDTVPKTDREFEALLRDSGYSRQQAVEITAHGFEADQRESEPEEEEQRESVTPEVEAEPQNVIPYLTLLRMRENESFLKEG